MDRTEVVSMVSKRARMLLVLAAISMISIGGSLPASAEPIACSPGEKGCWELSLEKKVQISFDRAAYVFVGQLESVQDSKSGGVKTRIFTFKIGRQYKDALAGKIVRISIDSDLTGGKAAGAGPQKSLSEFERLEAEAELVDTQEAKSRYEQRVSSLRGEIEKNGAAESAPTHVVHLELMLGDVPVRNTDIPMRIGEQYAVFVLSKAALAPDPKKDVVVFSSWISNPVDLYSMKGERGKRALAALVQASKSKRE